MNALQMLNRRAKSLVCGKGIHLVEEKEFVGLEEYAIVEQYVWR